MPRPNILWFISDDTGLDMIGATGGPRLTPHLDRMAREGVTCTQFHTTSPICTPSRYGYFTGRFPTRCAPGGGNTSPSATVRRKSRP
jgi:arylsulfatase A-like enzyme